MQCKIFTSENGYLMQGVGKTPILLEDSVNDFLKHLEAYNQMPLQILQTQSGEKGNFLTLTIFY